MKSASETAAPAQQKYLIFFLGTEEFGVEIGAIDEIIAMLPATRVPLAPACIRGVVNLRGKVITLIDLRSLLNAPPPDQPERCIIVATANGTTMGIVVDRVSEVAMIARDDIEPMPAFGHDAAILAGVSKHQGHVRLLINIQHVIAAGSQATSGVAV